MNADIVKPIRELARLVGYINCGVAAAGDFEEFERAIEDRIRRFPEAAGLYSKMFDRARPRVRHTWARSIIVCVRRYGKYRIPPGLAGRIGRTYLFDSRNPNCPDHVMAQRMKSGMERLGLRVRKGGVPDRWAGARAGVTRFGRNCFAYSEYGSWINLDTWLVDAELQPDKPSPGAACPDNCRACIDACPSGALIEPFVMRMDRCIAYLTYSAPGHIPGDLQDSMGSWLYGCDRCQEVCPLNNEAWEEREEAPWLEAIAPFLKPEALAEMDHEVFRSIIHPNFRYIPLENIRRWHDNARRVLANERICP